jgi:hypothetical protein
VGGNKVKSISYGLLNRLGLRIVDKGKGGIVKGAVDEGDKSLQILTKGLHQIYDGKTGNFKEFYEKIQKILSGGKVHFESRSFEQKLKRWVRFDIVSFNRGELVHSDSRMLLKGEADPFIQASKSTTEDECLLDALSSVTYSASQPIIKHVEFNRTCSPKSGIKGKGGKTKYDLTSMTMRWQSSSDEEKRFAVHDLLNKKFHKVSTSKEADALVNNLRNEREGYALMPTRWGWSLNINNVPIRIYADPLIGAANLQIVATLVNDLLKIQPRLLQIALAQRVKNVGVRYIPFHIIYSKTAKEDPHQLVKRIMHVDFRTELGALDAQLNHLKKSIYGTTGYNVRIGANAAFHDSPAAQFFFLKTHLDQDTSLHEIGHEFINLVDGFSAANLAKLFELYINRMAKALALNREQVQALVKMYSMKSLSKDEERLCSEILRLGNEKGWLPRKYSGVHYLEFWADIFAVAVGKEEVRDTTRSGYAIQRTHDYGHLISDYLEGYRIIENIPHPATPRPDKLHFMPIVEAMRIAINRGKSPSQIRRMLFERLMP